MAEESEPDRNGGDFATFLATVRPKTSRELNDELQRLVGKIRDTGKAGSLTLIVTIKPVDGDTAVLSVNDEIRVKAPEHTRQGSLAFPDDENNLSRTAQDQMPLFDVRFATGTVRPDDDLRRPPRVADEATRLPDHDARTGEIKEPPTA